MRKDLSEDPDVIAVATAMSMDVDLLIGKLHRLWSWADTHLQDDGVAPVTVGFLDEVARCKNLIKNLQKVGWIRVRKRSVLFVDYVRHNGSTAKTRAQTAARVRKTRKKKKPPCNARSVTNVTQQALTDKKREDKRREEAGEVSPAPPLADEPAKRGRARDALFDAVALCDGVDINKPIPKPTGKRIGAIAAELKAHSATAEQVRQRWAWVSSQYPQATIHALPKHWAAAGRAIDQQDASGVLNPFTSFGETEAFGDVSGGES